MKEKGTKDEHFEWLMSEICDTLEGGDVALDFEANPYMQGVIRSIMSIVGYELDGMRNRHEEVKQLRERLDWILKDRELAQYIFEKEVAYMEWAGVRLPWISADEGGEEE